MKTIKRRKMLIAFALLFTMAGCKKDDSSLTNDATGNTDNFESERCKKCLVSHTEDDVFGFSYDFHYNNNQDPDSLNGGVLTAQYDKCGRLAKKSYNVNGLQDYEKYYYQGNSSLPNVIKYIVPNYTSYGFTDSINAIDSVWYNNRGEMTRFKEVNIWYPGNDYSEYYTYNSHGNVINVTARPENGAAFTSFTVFSASLYDTKPNFIGNKWMKFLFTHLSYDPFTYLLPSKNNASTWIWAQRQFPGNPPYTFTSAFTYNQNGFPNLINIHATDGSFDLDFTRSSVSTCDNAQPRAIQRGSMNQNWKRKQKSNLPGLVPMNYGVSN